jgi:hypothetical protein
MDEKELMQGFTKLGELAESEYHESLKDITLDPDPQYRAIRLGRLVGVMLKQPFAEVQELSKPSSRTGAYRAYDLIDRREFGKPFRTETWQYQVLERMQKDASSHDNYIAQMSLYQFAEYAHHEVGFFAFLARDLRDYICGDTKIRKKVDDAIKKTASTTGTKLPKLTPEVIVGAGGLTLGAYLVQAIPILGMMGAPVIAAIVVILYTLGLDAFCEWSKSIRTDQDEKH